MNKDTVYIFRVIQNDIWSAPRIRGMPTVKLAIEPDKTLYQLAETILEAFYFENDHMIGFYDNWKRWTESKECYEEFVDEGEWSRCKKGIRKTKIREVFNKPKKRMLMLFDYGDEWHFIIDFLKEEKKKNDEKYPKILDRKGEPLPQYPNDDGFIIEIIKKIEENRN